MSQVPLQHMTAVHCNSDVPPMHALQEAAGGPKAALRVVSLHADLTNRGPTFDMDLAELERDGVPIPYEEARQYFKRDPAHRHAHAAQQERLEPKLSRYPSKSELDSLHDVAAVIISLTSVNHKELLLCCSVS